MEKIQLGRENVDGHSRWGSWKGTSMGETTWRKNKALKSQTVLSIPKFWINSLNVISGMDF